MPSDRTLTAIGLMAGTSLDGVDAAVLRTDGMGLTEAGASGFTPYDRDTKIKVRRAIKAALEGRDGATDIAEAANAVTSAHIAAVRDLLDKAHLRARDIDVIGFHGQTILHRSPVDAATPGRTWQIGSGRTLADELRIDVVEQLRSADVAAGGEGAPLLPAYHAALAQGLDRQGPLAVLNLGGVANITFVPLNPEGPDLLAFDCGPGNGLIDSWVEARTGQAMDEGGALASTGAVHEDVVRLMALNPFLRRPAPKSLDRYDFKLKPAEGLSAADGAATLTAFTAECVARSVRLLPAPPERWIVCGGGRHNPVLMGALRERLEGEVVASEAVGWAGDDVEAQGFAYLAVRSLKKLPISWPGTTRAPRPLTGGTYQAKPV